MAHSDPFLPSADRSLTLRKQRGLRPLRRAGRLRCSWRPGCGRFRVECEPPRMGTACGRARAEGTAIRTGPWIRWLPAMWISQGLPGWGGGGGRAVHAAFRDKLVCRHRRAGWPHCPERPIAGRSAQLLTARQEGWGSLSTLVSTTPGCVPGKGFGGLSSQPSPASAPPQATYVLLALAWVFVPIYISSEVSLFLGPWQRLDPHQAARAGRTSGASCHRARFD